MPNIVTTLAAPDEAEKRGVACLDSPARIRWLREQVQGYVTDLAARAYFRLETWCANKEIHAPKEEALSACANLATRHGLTSDECAAAFNTEWSRAMKLAVQVGEKLRIAALSHIKITGASAGVEQAMRQARNRFPADWPYLTDSDLDAIAVGFRWPAKRRRAA
jgi:hypothetical protein